MYYRGRCYVQITLPTHPVARTIEHHAKLAKIKFEEIFDLILVAEVSSLVFHYQVPGSSPTAEMYYLYRQ